MSEDEVTAREGEKGEEREWHHSVGDSLWNRDEGVQHELAVPGQRHLHRNGDDIEDETDPDDGHGREDPVHPLGVGREHPDDEQQGRAEEDRRHDAPHGRRNARSGTVRRADEVGWLW